MTALHQELAQPCVAMSPPAREADKPPLPRQAEAGLRVLLDGAARYQEKQRLVETLVARAEAAAQQADLPELAEAAQSYRAFQLRMRLEGRG